MSLMVSTSVLWGAIQVREFSQVLLTSAGVGLIDAVILAAVAAIGYPEPGGMLADIWTCFVWRLALLVGLGFCLQ